MKFDTLSLSQTRNEFNGWLLDITSRLAQFEGRETYLLERLGLPDDAPLHTVTMAIDKLLANEGSK